MHPEIAKSENVQGRVLCTGTAPGETSASRRRRRTTPDEFLRAEY
jgi:hypothetical protein